MIIICFHHEMSNGTLEARDLRLVRAIADAGGATRAAKLLALSQSAVSHQLRGLEDRLGVELFRRSGRKLVITAAGQRLVDVGHQVLTPLLQVELELKRGRLLQRPKLRVGAQCYTAYHWLPKVLQALAAEHPDVELVLEGQTIGDAAVALREDQLDVVLCVLPPKRGAFVHVPLFQDELALVVPRGHEFCSRKFVDGGDLASQTLILGSTSQFERERVRKALFADGAGPARVFRLPITEAALDLVQAGMGVSIQPIFTLSQRLERGELAVVRLTRHGLPRKWSGLYRKGSSVSAPIRTLLETLRRYGLPRSSA